MASTLSKKTLAALIFCAAAISNGVQAQPAAAHKKSAQAPAQAEQQAPVQEPVHYQLLLTGSLLLVMFGRRGAVRAQPWSNT